MSNLVTDTFILIKLTTIVRHGLEVVKASLRTRLRPIRRRNRNRRENNRASTLEASGENLFRDGEIGAAHLLAHRLFNQGRMAEGHRQLGNWLDGRCGTGSEWVHIQFHMAIFELEIGDWNAAFARFLEHVLPAAIASEDALTDAPALLWRLHLSAPASVELPWDELRAAALRQIQKPCDPFIELHQVLALAGAGDTSTIEHWVDTQSPCEDSSRSCLARRVAKALVAYSSGKYRQAASGFEKLLPQIARLGGSREQNTLFEKIAQSSSALGANDFQRAA